MDLDLAIIGAGVAGLTCAREAAAAGLSVLVLERARGVGGRCATRRVRGQPIDHGLAFFHGSRPDFVAELRAAAGAGTLENWPEQVRGSGTPCQPDAFANGVQRYAFPDGVSTFPKRLAKGVDVRLDTHVSSVGHGPDGVVLRTAAGDEICARGVVVALPCETTREMIAGLVPLSDELRAIEALLGMVGTHPCLTLLAGYGVGAPAPSWHVCYPEDSRVVQLIAHDSSKRREPRQLVLVVQAHPGWSRERLEAPPDEWRAELLLETARLAGPWAARPEWTHPHRWRYARVDRATELSAPVLVELPGGGRIGLAGEVFAPGGGVQAAFVSGRALAARLAGAGATP